MLEFLTGAGEVRSLMRARNWGETALGAPEAWPQSLSATVRLMLGSRFAMWMAWGDELTFLCNDAYLPTVGLKRDWVIGSRSDRVWAEIWADIGPRIDHVLKTGEATWDEALLLYLERSGFSEETYHTFSYSPLAYEGGGTAGMLCVVAEVTERVIGERQLATLRDLGVRLAAAIRRSEVMAALEACLADHPQDTPFVLAYLADADQSLRLAAAHGVPRGSESAPEQLPAEGATPFWPFARLQSERDGALVDAPGAAAPAGGYWQKPPTRALLLPIKGAEGDAPAGYLVAALNPHRPFDGAYRGYLELMTGQIAAAVARADEYERERARAAALAELDRAKTTFFSNVSHEFRTPLTLMLGPLEDALAEANSPAQQARLEIAHRNAMRLLRLVNSLLDFSRIEAGRMQANYRPTDLSALTAELASSFRSATEKAGLRLTVEAPPLPHPVYVDRDMWEKIVLNLVSNAFKFTFEGAISVTTGVRGDRAVLTVSDTGVGIPEAELPRLFERFHRVEGAKGRSFEGTGIGLALVSELVRQHGGEVSVESRLGKGTTFRVEVPFGAAHLPKERVEAEDVDVSTAVRTQSFVDEALRWLPGEGGLEAVIEPSANAFPGAGNESQQRRRVLLADDNADLRGYIARLMNERGYEVETAADGEDALAALRRAKPDLLVTDVMMPRLDGFGLLQRVREDPALRDLPVIMLSARAGEEAKVEGLDAGADDYLTKPFSARELLARASANIAMAGLRREAAEAIRASEAIAREQAERVQLALDSGAVVGTWVWDVPKDRITTDRRFARAFGLDPEICREGLSLQDVTESIHPDDRQAVNAAIEAALAAGGPYRHEYRVRGVDGVYRWIEANGRVDLDDEGRPLRFPGVLIDIDRRRAMEAELRDMNEQLEQRVTQAIAEREKAEAELRQAQKMEAVGQLTGGVAHDFNNLLTIIVGNVDIASRALRSGDSARASRALDNAQKGVDRASALTQRLLAFSRRQPLAPKPVNVDRLVAGMADLLHRSLSEMVQLEIVSTPGLWKVEVDVNQLESALLNLAVNARDAMPEGGKLTIETANARLDDHYAAMHAEVAPGNYVVIAVTDTGEGMSRETRSRAFDPFFTTKEIGKGTGLGLSMVYGFVKQSGGHVKIYSEPGEGTTVKIYLPQFLSSGEDEDVDAQAEATLASPTHQRILVVEDDDDVRSYTVEILRELGYRVIEAPDGPTALRLLERLDQPIDLLFTDVVMPAMSGRQLADAARKLRPGLNVLYTSGYSRNAIIHGGRLDPGVDMIVKPFSYQALAEKIANALEAARVVRLLVVGDGSPPVTASETLTGLGYLCDEAASASEALVRLRAARTRYEAAVLDMRHAEKGGVALIAKMRALRPDLLVVIATPHAETVRERLAGDTLTKVLAQPLSGATLEAALAEIGARAP